MSSPFPRRLVQSALVALVVVFCLPALAAADAPDVVSATGSVVSSDASGTVVEVHGTWAWTTHHSDCNTNRSGVGVAVDWGDNNGNHVTTLNGDSIDVGVLTATMFNAADNLAYPAEPPNLGAVSNVLANWRSTCGTFNGTFNTGTWGTVTSGPDAGAHYLTHKFPPGTLGQLTICALTYDVHGHSALTQPNGQKEITAGGGSRNTDNSAEKNGSTPAGNRCAPIIIKNHPQLTTDAGADKPAGSTLSDNATLTLASANATGTITFTLYGPNNATCTGPGIFTTTKPVAGNGTYNSGPSQVINAAGTYRWIANYGGDANNDATTNGCNGDHENVGVGQTTPSLTTNAGPAVSVGTAMHDSSTLSNVTAGATGTITFTLYGPDNATCTGPGIFTSTAPVNGPGTYLSANFTPTAGGTYRWIANYGGDANNAPTSNLCNATNENVFVNKLNPAVSTDAGPAVSLGSPLHDTATLSGATGTASGTITFDLYGPNDATCSVSIFTTTKSVSGNGPYVSADFTPTVAGTYRWVANYGGDGANNPTSNGCNGTNENVVVNKANPSVTTNAGNAVPLGTAIKDSATLSGGQNPQGTITFQLYGPNDAFCSTVIFTSVVTVSGNAVYQSGSFTPTQAGLYRWIANYSGDTNNNPTANACNGANESVDVGKSGPTVTTNAGPDQILGATLTDSATLAGGTNPTGKISFDLYGPNDGVCATSIFHSETTVNGNGTYQSTGFKPTTPGTYRWIANYTGDANNTATTNACNGTNENVVVTANAQIHVVKTGPASALAGNDVAFTLTVTNPGDQPLSNVVVDDARCDAIPPALQSKSGGNQDNVLDPGETWVYTCTAHTTAGATNLHNVVTACGKPPGAQVCDDDFKDVPLRNPDISIDKNGPTSVTAGATINYTLDVTNTGDQRFAESKVVVTDPKCDATPTLDSKNNDLTPSFLNPGETWRYVCSHKTLAGDTGTYHNVGFVTGTDEAGDVVTDDDPADTVINAAPAPAINLVKTGPASALAGSDVTFTLDVTNNGNQPLSNVVVTDVRCNASAPALDSKHGDASPGTLDPGDLWTYKCTAHTAAGDTSLQNTGNVCADPPVGAQVCDTDTTTVPLRNPNILIDKNGPASITAGGTINYTLDVTNTGDQRFAEAKVVVTDPKCDATPTLSSKNGDLTPAFLNQGETWRYVCSHVTKNTDTGTYHNVGLVTGTDEAGDVVNDDDPADTVINPPGNPPCTVNCGGGSEPNPKIAVIKVGPTSALAGSDVTFQLTVTNPGTEPLTKVTVTDARCNALPPTLLNNNGDSTPNTLNPGDVWIYTCTSHTAASDTTLHNDVTACGQSPASQQICAPGSADVPLVAPAQQVEPLLPGVSRLRGPTGCIAARTHVLRVTGSRIARVSFYLDGRFIGTRTRPNSGSAYTLTVRGAKLRRGSHIAVARVTYQPGTTPTTKTMRLTFARCARALTPKFTG